MTRPDDLTDEYAKALARELETLYKLLPAVREYQWQVPPGTELVAQEGDPGVHEVGPSGTIKQKGQITDLVGSTVVDDARMRLRTANGQASEALQQAYEHVAGARAAVQRALRPYGAHEVCPSGQK